MSDLRFAVTGARHHPAAAAPTLRLRLQVGAGADRAVESILLRCQIRIEPARRRYDAQTQARLVDLFGEPHRWADTLLAFQLTHVTLPVRGFVGSTTVDLPVELSYDLEVAVGTYLHALRDGAVPLLLLFSGTVFHRTPTGLQVEQIPWDREAAFDLPVAVWRAAIDSRYPGTGWLRLHRDTIDALQSYKHARGLATWDDTVDALLAAAGGDGPADGNGAGPTRNGHRAGDPGGSGSSSGRGDADTQGRTP